MPKSPVPPDTRDATIRELQTRLYFARRTIVELMPREIRKFLEASTWCESHHDIGAWQTWAVEAMLNFADKEPGEDMDGPVGTFRAYCPLCGGGSSGACGYAMPIGMERHLEGSHGNRRCEVFAAAIEPAYESVREKAQAGYRGPNFSHMRQGDPPWAAKPPSTQPIRNRPSAKLFEFPQRPAGAPE